LKKFFKSFSITLERETRERERRDFGVKGNEGEGAAIYRKIWGGNFGKYLELLVFLFS